MKIKEKLLIRLDDINPHWQMLRVCGEEVDDDFSVMEEWNDIQECLKKVLYKMKLHIKETMRQLAFPEDTMLSPPPKKMVTKGAKKRVRSTRKSHLRVESHLCGSMLTPNFSMVNRHKLSHHFQREKVQV